jgi:hypothetical protein
MPAFTLGTATLNYTNTGSGLPFVLLGIARAVVGGISMGAGAALNVVVRYPERVAGLVRDLDFSIGTDEGLTWAWQKLDRDSFLRHLSGAPMGSWQRAAA